MYLLEAQSTAKAECDPVKTSLVPEPTIESNNNNNNNNNKRKLVSSQMTFVPIKSTKSSKSKANNQIEKHLFQDKENLPIEVNKIEVISNYILNHTSIQFYKLLLFFNQVNIQPKKIDEAKKETKKTKAKEKKMTTKESQDKSSSDKKDDDLTKIKARVLRSNASVTFYFLK